MITILSWAADGLRGKVNDHHEKTLNLTEQDTCNTSYPGEPEEFKKLVDDKHPNASPIAEFQAS